VGASTPGMAHSMKMESAHLSDDQLVSVHQQMIESQASYRNKLQNSQEAQHRQAILVQKLQGKVLQYRNWCRDLEQRLEASRASYSLRQDNKKDHSLEKALIQLEEEQQRCQNLAGVNILLRDHLDKANEVNGALREDVSKLTADWTKARDELEYKESEWHKERKFFESYMRAEHDRIIGIWRQVVTLHRYFLEMKTATDRDLSELKVEQMRLSGSILISCFQLSSDTRLLEMSNLESSVLKGSLQQQQQQLYLKPEKTDMEKEIYQQTQAIMNLRVKGDLAREDLQSRVIELTALLEQSQKENEEKEKTVKTLRDTLEVLLCWLSLTLYALCSYLRALSFPYCVLTFFNYNFFQHLRQQLLASQNSITSLEKQQEQQEEHSRFQGQRLEQLEKERETFTSQIQHQQSTIETYSRDYATLEKSRTELQQHLEVLEQEVWHLRQNNTELQLKGDMVNGEKEEQQQELQRMMREREICCCWVIQTRNRVCVLYYKGN
uniref:Rootletin-like coiled-coil domain-containing protein n=1 Tax=Anolis carolinensis TaxID=28377 RepID=A0A803SSN8_ANOCA